MRIAHPLQDGKDEGYPTHAFFCKEDATQSAGISPVGRGILDAPSMPYTNAGFFQKSNQCFT